ncbi:MAG TPA: hypothetical protein VN282_11840 [Pyrinomonadaceae bacterium]|nr:hypothetical protein [Pyrinomonadaceae bacterium]
MNEVLDMRGSVTLLVTDRDGAVVYERREHNRIVKSGRDLVAKLFAGAPGQQQPTRVTHMGVGTDGTEPTDDQTALLKERPARDGVPRKPIEEVSFAEFADAGVKRVRVTLRAVFDFEEANGAEPLREAAVFNAASGGVMYNRVTFKDVTKTNAFKLTLLWDITF